MNRPLHDIHVAMEAIGTYHEALAHCLLDHQINVSVIDSAHARDFANGLGLSIKPIKPTVSFWLVTE